MDLMPLFSNLKEISIFARSRLEYFGCFVSTDCLKLKICGSGCSLRSRSPRFESSSFVDRLALKAGCLRAAGGTVMDCSYLQKSSLSSHKHLQYFLLWSCYAIAQRSIGRFLVNGRKDRYRNGMERDGNGKSVWPDGYKRLPVIYRLPPLIFRR